MARAASTELVFSEVVAERAPADAEYLSGGLLDSRRDFQSRVECWTGHKLSRADRSDVAIGALVALGFWLSVRLLSLASRPLAG